MATKHLFMLQSIAFCCLLCCCWLSRFSFLTSVSSIVRLSMLLSCDKFLLKAPNDEVCMSKGELMCHFEIQRSDHWFLLQNAWELQQCFSRQWTFLLILVKIFRNLFAGILRLNILETIGSRLTTGNCQITRFVFVMRSDKKFSGFQSTSLASRESWQKSLSPQKNPKTNRFQWRKLKLCTRAACAI